MARPGILRPSWKSLQLTDMSPEAQRDMQTSEMEQQIHRRPDQRGNSNTWKQVFSSETKNIALKYTHPFIYHLSTYHIYLLGVRVKGQFYQAGSLLPLFSSGDWTQVKWTLDIWCTYHLSHPIGSQIRPFSRQW